MSVPGSGRKVTTREEVLVSYSQNGTYISNKFNISANSNLPALVDFQPLIRVTEMYYIQAEAALKDGDKKTAAELLNTVSSHRGIPETSFLLLDGE